MPLDAADPRLETACRSRFARWRRLLPLLLLGALAACASEHPVTTMSARALSAADRNFIVQAAAGGMSEVELGRLSQKRSGNSDVQTFGQQMVTDTWPSTRICWSLPRAMA